MKNQTNLIKIDFKKLSKPTDKKAMQKYNKKHPIKKGKRPCNQAFIKSVERFDKACKSLHTERKIFDYTINIEYWKKHGKLPSDVDMAKIKGKGMYSTNSKNYRRETKPMPVSAGLTKLKTGENHDNL